MCTSRRNSLDIYTAEYAIKMNPKDKRVDSMEQKSTFHLKVCHVNHKLIFEQ